MTLSEVFYEAACEQSDEYPTNGSWTCGSVYRASGCRWDEADEYSKLMGEIEGAPICSEQMYKAAHCIGWTVKEFRVFVLLMASEAVKE